MWLIRSIIIPSKFASTLSLIKQTFCLNNFFTYLSCRKVYPNIDELFFFLFFLKLLIVSTNYKLTQFSLVIRHVLHQFQWLYLHRRITGLCIQKWTFTARTTCITVTVPRTTTFATLILVRIECHDLLSLTILVILINIFLMASVIGGSFGFVVTVVVRMIVTWMFRARFYRIVRTVGRACV